MFNNSILEEKLNKIQTGLVELALEYAKIQLKLYIFMV